MVPVLECRQVVPPHEDGSIIFEEEAIEFINSLPVDGEYTSLVPIQLDCTIEEYCQHTGAMLMDDFTNMVCCYSKIMEEGSGCCPPDL